MTIRFDNPRDHSALTADPLTDATDYPIYVVTAGYGDDVSGCLAGFVTQASIHPVRFLVCVSKVNHTYAIAERATGLGLHLLGSDQRDMAALFGEHSGDDCNKLDRVKWSVGATGAPLLAECAAWIEGSIADRMSTGDHVAFLIDAGDGGAGRHTGSLMLHEVSDFHPGHPL